MTFKVKKTEYKFVLMDVFLKISIQKKDENVMRLRNKFHKVMKESAF